MHCPLDPKGCSRQLGAIGTAEQDAWDHLETWLRCSGYSGLLGLLAQTVATWVQALG